MSDQPDRPDRGDPVSGGAAEPVLGTSAEEVQLEEPSLGPAEISEATAEAASLDDAAAEAKAVEQEAEDVGALLGGPHRHGDPVGAAPSGTAPAGGKAGDVEGGGADGGGTSVESVQSARHHPEEGPVTLPRGIPEPPADAPGKAIPPPEPGPSAPWVQPFPTPRTPADPQPPPGGAYGLPPAGSERPSGGMGGSRRPRTRAGGTSRRTLIILAAAGLLVLGLLIFSIIGIVNALRGDDSQGGSSAASTPGADGIIAEDFSPLELAAGACVLDFDSGDVSAPVTTVTCTTPHNAQLLATERFSDDAEFPGDAELNARGDELCNSVPINESAAANYSGLTLTQVTPTSGTWAEGDRRIDCFVVSDEGNVITDTLLAE